MPDGWIRSFAGFIGESSSPARPSARSSTSRYAPIKSCNIAAQRQMLVGPPYSLDPDRSNFDQAEGKMLVWPCTCACR